MRCMILAACATLAVAQIGVGTPPRGGGTPVVPTNPADIAPEGTPVDNILDSGLTTEVDEIEGSGLTANFAGERSVSTTTYSPGCMAVWAKGKNNECFSKLKPVWPRNQWGWTNIVYKSREVMDLWGNALGCDTSVATHIGTLEVSVSRGVVTLTATINAGYAVKDLRFYVGATKLPIRHGWYKASPFYYAWKYLSRGPHGCTKPNGNLWVAFYAEVCKDCVDVGGATSIVKVINVDGSDWNDGSNALAPETVSEGMLGWTLDDTDVTLHNFPPILLLPNMRVFFPEQQQAIPVGRKIRFQCPANCDDLPCELIITTYHCPPCSSSTNGNFPSTMPVAGWTPAHCSPRFRYSSKKYEMVGFRKLLAAGETEDTPDLEIPLSNVAVFVRQGAANCAGISLSSSCAGNSECYWDQDECKSRWCPPNPPGDRPTCEPCAPNGL